MLNKTISTGRIAASDHHHPAKAPVQRGALSREQLRKIVQDMLG